MQVQFRDAAEWRKSSQYQDASRAGQFVTIAREIMLANNKTPDWANIAQKYANEPSHGRIQSFAKAVVAAAGTGDPWSTSDGFILSEGYLSAVAGANLVDAVKRWAYPFPDFKQRAVIASGVIASEVGEGGAKPLTPIGIATDEPSEYKVAAILVMTDELLRSKTQVTENLFRRLLRDAVIRASNASFLARVDTTSAAAGATALESLENGLSAADDSEGYVVAATPSITRQLALVSEGRMGVGGGDFLPGVQILPALEATSGGPDMIVIPASGIAITDNGLELRSAAHATVEMSDTPANPSTAATVQVSLWQNNLLGLLCERRVAVCSNVSAVEVG